ncbi:hypothetical protein ATEIFO6365_0002078600 [Aspergillus terreus]|uniref:Uncharacterized protein n=1 Tax=Aspergillus terreus TaxID=33178 RepID=A0A5M3YSK3_ASPTE|nr:hypothetical protein ATETN484_0002002600 [Aspergillus terreus]GFF13675.1 hypothetical protein ATEIFO6365_0002078600 [Aspergillus terreus]
METDIPNRVVDIAADGDRVIKVNEYEDRDDASSTNEPVLKRTGTFKVNSKTLADKSSYFSGMFRTEWRESSNQIILKHDNVKVMEDLLHFMHGAAVAVDSLSIPDVWHLIKSADKYLFPLKKMAVWFAKWFEHQRAQKTAGDYQTLPECEFERQLLFPCWAFDYAAGFQYLTRHLAYNMGGHITESNPTRLRETHLPPRVIQQLNAARGRLRNILHRDLFDATKNIMDFSFCGCKEYTVFYYLCELRRVNIWPMEEVSTRKSINTMLEWLNDFDEENMRKTMSSSAFGSKALCYRCNRPWKQIVDAAIKKVRKYFDGLCLDCMGKSKRVRLDIDDVYWGHDEDRERYDEGCRVRHGEPTHYFSFMGRREKRGLIAD